MRTNLSGPFLSFFLSFSLFLIFFHFYLFYPDHALIFALIFRLQADSARSKAKEAEKGAKESWEKLDQIRHDTANKLGTTVDKIDRTVEEKASEAKKSVSSWFGGSK
jgi:4-diphosphocytidyl-2C-methyl-D-erythritol kinase